MDILTVFTLYLLYGLAFFAIGFSIIFRNYKNSQISISKLLPILAAFGFIHGIHEWSELYFILIEHKQYETQNVELFKVVKLWLSYLLLGAFGWKMFDLIDRPWVKWAKLAIIALLLMFINSLIDRYDEQAFIVYITTSSQHVRLLFGLGSGVLAGMMLIIYAKQFYDADHQAATPFVYTGAAVIFYGITSGWLSSEFGVWVIFARTLCAIAILFFLWKALRIFDREREQQIESMLHDSYQDAKMKELGELTSAVAHEVKTPLSSALMSCDLLQARLPDNEDVNRQLVRIRGGIEKAAHISHEVLNYAHHREMKREPVNVSQLCQSALSLVEYRLSDFMVSSHIPDRLHVLGDKVYLEEVLVNVLVNAIDASEDFKSITINAKELGTNIVIELEDSGKGIAEELLDKVYQPFYTTKPVGKGTGMGLSISKQIILQHHGQLILKNTNFGLQVQVILPKAMK